MRTLPLLTLALATAAAGLGCESGASVGTGPDDSPGPAGITVIPSATTLAGGRSLRLIAKVLGNDGSITTPVEVRWQSADGAIASVDGTGMVHGLLPGQVLIVATWGNVRGSSLVTVLEPVTKRPTPLCREQATAGAASDIPKTGKCP